MVNFFHASCDVFALGMRGVMVGDVEARMALSMSLSYQTQGVLLKAEESTEVGHLEALVT